MCNALSDAGFQVHEPEGTYYVIAGITSFGFKNDVEACRTLIRDAGVAAIPASAFWNNKNYGSDLLRFCFCKNDNTLEEGIRRLINWKK